ncbi:hypothetical protein TNCV_2340741 [Trichonephila clavipes]|nr:hypothetical protein TNCV_2340741 [Trichonephila clavipes]
MMPQTKTPRPPYPSLSMMFEDDCASPLYSDEYAMRIAIKLNLLSSVKSTSYSLSLKIPVYGTTENALLRWAGVKGIHRTGRRATDHHRASSGHGKTRYRSSSRLCRVPSDFSRLFLLACETMYRSYMWFLVDDHF